VSGPDIFISYSRQERAVARLFAESFVEEGLKVWWDAVLHSGETFDEVIERNLRAAKAVVVLWSPLSVASRWVRAEATQADRSNKLVPVIIEPCNLPIIFELTHTTDLGGWQGDKSDSRWQSLIFDLRRLVGPAESEVVAPAIVPAAPVQVMSPPAAPQPANQDEISADELAKALERIAKDKNSALLDPTEEEIAQAEFFKRSDEFRREESELVHCLRRVYADESEALHVVGPDGLKIGRTAPADLVVSEPGVSREHCVVELAADKLRVMDLNSTNGTYIDNKRIGRAEILPVGSILRVGNIAFEHELIPRAGVPQLRNSVFGRADKSEPRIARTS
jgi:hypothetical protein